MIGLTLGHSIQTSVLSLLLSARGWCPSTFRAEPQIPSHLDPQTVGGRGWRMSLFMRGRWGTGALSSHHILDALSSNSHPLTYSPRWASCAQAVEEGTQAESKVSLRSRPVNSQPDMNPVHKLPKPVFFFLNHVAFFIFLNFIEV